MGEQSLPRLRSTHILTETISQPLHLSTFTMDEYEAGLRHSVVEPICPLLAEIHSTLIYNLRTVPSNRHAAVISLTDKDDNPDIDTLVLGVSVDSLTSAMADIGNNWERAPLRHGEGRDGWEESLIGCLKDVGQALKRLTFYY